MKRNKARVPRPIASAHAEIAQHLDAVKELFSCPVRATLILRLNNDEEMDVFVSDDDSGEVLSAVIRARRRELDPKTLRFETSEVRHG